MYPSSFVSILIICKASSLRNLMVGEHCFGLEAFSIRRAYHGVQTQALLSLIRTNFRTEESIPYTIHKIYLVNSTNPCLYIFDKTEYYVFSKLIEGIFFKVIYRVIHYSSFIVQLKIVKMVLSHHTPKSQQLPLNTV